MGLNKNIISEHFTAMILSAGLGTRLKPLTEFIPKPLAPICGRALLLRILDKIFTCGISYALVNLHYKSKEIEKIVNKEYRGKVHFSLEKKILGTGGGISKCKELVSAKEFFILYNGDVLSSIELKELIAVHLESGFAGTLLLVDGDDNKISLKEGKICGINSNGGCENRKLYTYSGIAVFSKRIFDFFPNDKENFPLIEVFRNALEADALGGYAPENIYWRDIGSLEKYFSAHEEIFNSPNLQKILGFPLKTSAEYKKSGFICLPDGGDYFIGKDAQLHNCIVLEGARIAKGTVRKNEVIGRNFSIHRDSPAIMKLSFFRPCDFRKIQISELQEQGSNRKFYRIKKGRKKTEILMISSSEDIDFNRFIRLGKYFRHKGIYVSKIHKYSRKAYAVLMEDLGNLTLNKAIKSGSDKYSLMNGAIDFLLDFQIKTYKTAKRIVNREFGFEGLRWESEYFMNNFVAKFAELDLKEFSGLETEFDAIAKEAMRAPQLLCHRDFQSQNIMVQEDGKICAVDFQGARIGPFIYDLMSLLRDAYIELSEDEIQSLSKYYFERFNRVFSSIFPPLSEEEFEKFATLCAMQRVMQALGAFAYLGLVKGKKNYLGYIGRGFYNLERVYISLALYYPGKFSAIAELLKILEKRVKNKRQG